MLKQLTVFFTPSLTSGFFDLFLFQVTQSAVNYGIEYVAVVLQYRSHKISLPAVKSL